MRLRGIIGVATILVGTDGADGRPGAAAGLGPWCVSMTTGPSVPAPLTQRSSGRSTRPSPGTRFGCVEGRTPVTSSKSTRQKNQSRRTNSRCIGHRLPRGQRHLSHDAGRGQQRNPSGRHDAHVDGLVVIAGDTADPASSSWTRVGIPGQPQRRGQHRIRHRGGKQRCPSDGGRTQLRPGRELRRHSSQDGTLRNAVIRLNTTVGNVLGSRRKSRNPATTSPSPGTRHAATRSRSRCPAPSAARSPATTVIDGRRGHGPGHGHRQRQHRSRRHRKHDHRRQGQGRPDHLHNRVLRGHHPRIEYRTFHHRQCGSRRIRVRHVHRRAGNITQSLYLRNTIRTTSPAASPSAPAMTTTP